MTTNTLNDLLINAPTTLGDLIDSPEYQRIALPVAHVEILDADDVRVMRHIASLNISDRLRVQTMLLNFD